MRSFLRRSGIVFETGGAYDADAGRGVVPGKAGAAEEEAGSPVGGNAVAGVEVGTRDGDEGEGVFRNFRTQPGEGALGGDHRFQWSGLRRKDLYGEPVIGLEKRREPGCLYADGKKIDRALIAPNFRTTGDGVGNERLSKFLPLRKPVIRTR